jgi:glucokinase
MACLGIEIGGTKLQSAVVDQTGAVLLRRADRVDPAKAADGLRGALAAQLREIAAAWAGSAGRGPLVAAGIGFGGPVDRDRGVVAASFHVSGWNGFPLAEWVSGVLGGLPVVLENDSNAAALAEATVGAGHGRRLVFYSNAGSGIGAGFVIDGAIYRGRSSGEMELGHLRLGPDGGILEDVAAGWAIDRLARDEASAHPQGAVAVRAAGAAADARHVAAAAAAGDAAATAILDGAARHYAWALSHAVHLLNPHAIVLGGGVAEIGPAWRDRVAAGLEDFLMAPLRPAPDVVLAQLGQDVVPVGAALAAMAAARA